MYPKEVLDTSTFILEGYIEGEEYAIDCYFDNEGNVDYNRIELFRLQIMLFSLHMQKKMFGME